MAKYDRYYKVGQLYYKEECLLQSWTLYRSKMHQGVGQKNVLPSLTPLICLYSRMANGGTYLQIGSIWFEWRLV